MNAVNAFASLLVVLPSYHSGGAIRASHKGRTEQFAGAIDGLSNTVVVMVYPGTRLEMLPITSGFCVILRYNVIHTSPLPIRLGLSQAAEFEAQLAPLLLSWKENPDRHAPRKLLYLLNGNYSAGKLSLGQLISTDAKIAARLQSVACKLGMHLGLAIVSRHTTKCPCEDSEGEDNACEGYSYQEEHPFDKTKIMHLVGLDGTVIADGLPFKETEAIPEDMIEIVESRERFVKKRTVSICNLM